ncbi:hypothetical protein BC332_06861 [Capsicum chinense]|nr:hypothetical protein BC332_06861 [Capsicum chinense]
MAQNENKEMFDDLRRIKIVGDLDSLDIDQIEKLEMDLRLLRTFVKYHHVLLPDSTVILTKTANLILKMLHQDFNLIPYECTTNLNLERLESHLFEFIEEINGYVNHEKLECLETRLQFMANNVGQFCLTVLVDVKSEDDIFNMSKDDIFNEPPCLLCLIVLVELEMKKIFLGELQASKFTQPKIFKDKKLPKGFSHQLHSLLMYLKNKKLDNFPNNIDMAIEFLLVFLDADVSNHVNNGNWLNEVMEKVAAIAGDVLYVIQKLLPRSIDKDATSEIDIFSMQILEKTKDLKAPVESNYKSLKFTPSQFRCTFVGLRFLDSLLSKLNEMLKSKSDLDFLMKPLFDNLERELSSLTSILEEEI